MHYLFLKISQRTRLKRIILLMMTTITLYLHGIVAITIHWREVKLENQLRRLRQEKQGCPTNIMKLGFTIH